MFSLIKLFLSPPTAAMWCRKGKPGKCRALVRMLVGWMENRPKYQQQQSRRLIQVVSSTATLPATRYHTRWHTSRHNRSSERTVGIAYLRRSDCSSMSSICNSLRLVSHHGIGWCGGMVDSIQTSAPPHQPGT
uniref:Putative secreted protein n=1 Tax=Anopheles darlingi TaxID=43151 RepID=A0A2M4DEE2_ANODA